jgi:hypothetical protein
MRLFDSNQICCHDGCQHQCEFWLRFEVSEQHTFDTSQLKIYHGWALMMGHKNILGYHDSNQRPHMCDVTLFGSNRYAVMMAVSISVRFGLGFEVNRATYFWHISAQNVDIMAGLWWLAIKISWAIMTPIIGPICAVQNWLTTTDIWFDAYTHFLSFCSGLRILLLCFKFCNSWIDFEFSSIKWDYSWTIFIEPELWRGILFSHGSWLFRPEPISRICTLANDVTVLMT